MRPEQKYVCLLLHARKSRVDMWGIYLILYHFFSLLHAALDVNAFSKIAASKVVGYVDLFKSTELVLYADI